MSNIAQGETHTIIKAATAKYILRMYGEIALRG